MIKRLLPLLLVLGGFLAHAAPARAETYYIDYVGGSNAYDGKEKIHTTGITGPWKNGHGQGNCSDLCSSTTINPGDRMVYKGGVTWPFPEPLWNVLYSGSAGNPITVTTDATWYTGVAWSRPIWDNEYTYQVIVYMASQSYWDFEGIEMKRIQVHDPGEGGMFLIIGNSAHINFRNLYIHGWRLDGTGQRRDGKQGGININPDVGSQAQSIRIEDSEIENSENTGVYTNNGYGLKYVGTVLRTSIHDMPAATIQVLDVDGSEMYNIGHPSGNGSAGGGLAYPDDPHLNVAYVDPGALFATTGYIRNSIFHDNDGGLEGMAMCLANGNFGEREVFIYNNLFYGVMPASSGAIALDPYDPNGTMVGGSCYVYNNTIYMQDSTRQLAIGGNGRSDTNYTNISIQNNHFIGNGSGHPYTDLTQ